MGKMCTFIWGAAIGAVLGILYAPRSGKETQAMLKEKFMQSKEKVADVAESMQQKAEEQTES